jgi:hypothetical protein
LPNAICHRTQNEQASKLIANEEIDGLEGDQHKERAEGKPDQEASAQRPFSPSAPIVGAKDERVLSEIAGPESGGATKDEEKVGLVHWTPGEKWVVATNAILAFVALLALGVYWKQLGVMKKQLSSMSGQLEQMKVSGTDTHDLASSTKVLATNAANQVKELHNGVSQQRLLASTSQGTLDLYRRYFQKAQRPVVWVQANAPELAAGKPAAWSVLATNSGPVPAVRFRMCAGLTNGPSASERINLDQICPHSVMDVTGGSIAAPGVVGQNYKTAFSEVPLTQEMIDSMNAFNDSLAVGGAILYEDSYGNKYRSTFCMFRLANGAVGYCAKGNDLQ